MTGGDGLDRAVLDRIDATIERAVQRGRGAAKRVSRVALTCP